MKRITAFLLLVALVLPLLSGSMTVGAENVTQKPFYMVNVGTVEPEYQYVYYMPFFWTRPVAEGDTDITVSVYGTTDPIKIAAAMKEDFDARPAGARYVNLSTVPDVFLDCVVDVVDLTRGVTLVKNWLEKFLAEYKRIGGQLDGFCVDLEYNRAYAFYIEDKQYGSAASDSAQNKNIYNEIVANPVYQTRIRPKLVERGFEFWPADKIGGDKSEIWSMYRYSGDYYAKDRSIWDAVIGELLAEYINEAVLEPMLKYYPDGIMSDYHRCDTYSWQKGVNDHGETVGRAVKVGNASCYNLYDCRPNHNVFKYKTDSATGLQRRTSYTSPASYNGAVYEDNPFGYALWDVNLHKRILEATDTGIINTHLSYFNYGDGYSRTPYYSEAVLHVGLMNPQPFFGYIVKSEVERKGDKYADPDLGDYEYNIMVVNQLLAELTRVVGYSDRKAIVSPMQWNGSYILTGMYANGRNVWRITPDTTKVSLADFKVAGEDPTFSVDGLTITFPKGKIIETGKVSKIGTCGYWVETPADVNPIVTSTADRYRENPAFLEAFEGYKNGAFTTASAYPHTYWNVTGTAAIQTVNGNQAVALSGDTELKNTTIPANITAGDSYAKQQAWEVTVTLPEGNYGTVNLLRCVESEGGFKIEDGKIYYSERGAYQELCSVSAGTYTLKREVDFRKTNAYTSSFCVYDAQGKLIKEVKDVPMVLFNAPVQNISLQVTGASAAVLIDDYKLYATGVATDFELYDVKYGKKLTDSGERTADTAYRLSWMNASSEPKTAKVVDVKSGTVIKTVEMAPGMDGVVTGIVNADGKAIQLKLEFLSDTPAGSEPDSQNPTENNDGNVGNTENGETNDITNSTDDTQTPDKQGSGVWLWIVITIVLAGAGTAVYLFVIYPKKKKA